MKTRCMLCEKLTDHPVESKRPRGIKDIWGISSCMICSECRENKQEWLFWRGLGEEWEGRLLTKIMEEHTRDQKHDKH